MATPAVPRKAEVALDVGLRKDVGKLSLLFTGVGAIIGSGWLFGALYASQIAGPAAIFSWVVGAIIFMFIGLVYAELATMFPVAGGLVRFPQYAFGSFAGYSSGWLTWLASATVTPIEVLAVTQYADPYIQDIGINLMHRVAGPDSPLVLTNVPGIPIAVALMFVFSLINVAGVKLFAQFNNVLVWWKLLVIALVVVMFFVLEFNPANLTTQGFVPNGLGAIFVAIPAGGVAFAYLGFRNAVEYAAESTDPQRHVPFAVIWSIVITAVIYILLQLAFITGLPTELLGQGWGALTFAEEAGPLAGLSLLLGATWLAIVLRIDAVVSPGDTGLIYAGVTTRNAYANARNHNAPQWLEHLNNRGIPWKAVVLGFVVGCIAFLPFPGWAVFIGFVTSAFAVSFGPGSVVVGAIRRQLPDQPRPFRLPGGDIIPLIGFFGSSLLVFWSGWSVNEKMLIAFLLGYVVYTAYYLTAKRELPALDIKHGLWFPIWIVGLVALSYFGDVAPGSEEPAGLVFQGGTGPVGLGIGAIIVAVWSVLMYYVGVASRLSPEKARDNIERIPAADLPDEPERAQ